MRSSDSTARFVSYKTNSTADALKSRPARIGPIRSKRGPQSPNAAGASSRAIPARSVVITRICPNVRRRSGYPKDEQRCPVCGEPFAEMSDEEISEQIEIEIGAYRQKLIRKRYRSRCNCAGCSRTVTAPVPAKLIPKGRLGTSVWAEILLDKYYGHCSTGRLIERLHLIGLDLAPGTITSGLQVIEPMFAPIYEAICERQGLSYYYQADETRWLVFIEQQGKSGHRWWLWLFVGEDTCVFRLDPSRSHDVPEQHFPSHVHGVLLVDRYSAYKAMAQVKEGTLLLAFCWAHVRRDFVKVGKGWPELKDWAVCWLERIRQLYRLNRERLHHPAGSDTFGNADAKLREQAGQMRQQLDEELAEATIREPVRKTLESLQEHWEGLTRFIDDPRIPMDNNGSERTVRGPATGRKNYYGSGAQWSGRLAATLFSIFATLRLWQINSRAWLTWYLQACAAADSQAPDDISRFLPWNLSDERRAELNSHPPPPVVRHCLTCRRAFLTTEPSLHLFIGCSVRSG